MGVLVAALLICACGAQLIYPDNEAHSLLTMLPASSPSPLFRSYFYSISGIAINASGYIYLADSARGTIYLAELNEKDGPPSPAPIIVGENAIGGLAFDDKANLLFWIEYDDANTSLYSFNCTSNGPTSLVGAVPSTVAQLSLDTNNSIVYLSSSATVTGMFYSIPYANGSSQPTLPALTNSSILIYSQLWVDMTTQGSFYYVQRNVRARMSSIMHYVAGGQPDVVLSINSSVLSATFDTMQDTVIFSDGIDLYRCSLDDCISPTPIATLPQAQMPLLYLYPGSLSYELALGGFLYQLPRTPFNASALYNPVLAPLTVDAMDIDAIHDLVYWLSPFGTVEYLNLTSLAWGILAAFPYDVELLDIATDARNAQTYVSTTLGLYRLQVGEAPELITLQKYRRSIEFISVDAYFSELYFYDREEKQIHRCQLRQSSTMCDAVTLLASASVIDSMEFGAGALYWSVNGTLRSLDINADAVVTVATARTSILPLSLAMSTGTENTLAWLDGSRSGYVQLMLCSILTSHRSSCQPQNKASTALHTASPRLAATANGSFCVLTSSTGNVSCASPPSYSFHSVTGLRGYTIVDIAYDTVHNALIASSPTPVILALLLSGSNNNVTHCTLPPDVVVGPVHVLSSGDILYANQAASTIEVCTAGCQGCPNASVLFTLPDTTPISAIAVDSTGVYVSLHSGNVYSFVGGHLQLVRYAVAPIAGLTLAAGSLVWSHTVQGCILSAPAVASTAPYATVYAGANSADGLQVYIQNDTLFAAWRYPPSEPTTVQLLPLEKSGAAIQVAVVTSMAVDDFVYYVHIDSPYYRTVHVNETYAWMIIAGIAVLGVFVVSLQFVYRAFVRAEEEAEADELRRDENEKERHKASHEDSDEHPLLQAA